MENVKEVAPVVGAIAKGAAVAAKATAKAAAAGGKTAAKAGAKAAKATKPVSKNLRFKRPNIKSYKDPKTGQVDMDRYRSDQAKYKKIQQDKKNRPDMSQTKPDGPSQDRTARGERKLRAIDKITDKKKEDIKQGLQTTGDVAGKVVKKTANVAKKGISSVSSTYGTSSFSKESKITFQQFIDKTP